MKDPIINVTKYVQDIYEKKLQNSDQQNQRAK